MDCKKALEESNGDFEAAVDFLRKKGAKVAANRQDRDAKEGVVLAKTSPDNRSAVVISVNCETDFVAKNAEFIQFAESVAAIALTKKPASIDELKALPYNNDITVGDKFMEQIGKIGEKIDIGYYQTISAEKVVGYIHPGNRLSVAVGFNKSVSDEVAKNIAMQAAAMPRFRRRAPSSGRPSLTQMLRGMRQFSPLFVRQAGGSEQSGSAPCGPRPPLRKHGTWWRHGFMAVTL